MSGFVLVPGAGGVAWYWHRVVPLLREAGHEAIAVDLPGDDRARGLPEYATLVRAAIESMTASADVVLVAQSMGAFTAAMTADTAGVRAVVLCNAMIPVPGETPGQWWANTEWLSARIAAAQAGGYSADFDLSLYFLHDVPPEIAAAGEPLQHDEADIAFCSVCEFSAWPAVPIHVLAGAQDRFFPVEFQRQLARRRVDVEAEVVPGGHLFALSRPQELTARLLSV